MRSGKGSGKPPPALVLDGSRPEDAKAVAKLHRNGKDKPPERITAEERATCDRIFDLVSAGLSLNKACEAIGTPRPTVAGWVRVDDEIANRYSRARQLQAEVWAEEIKDLSDDASADTMLDSEGRTVINHAAVQRNRLQVNARQWLLSKTMPQVFGDQVTVRSANSDPGADQGLSGWLKGQSKQQPHSVYEPGESADGEE